MSPEKKGLNIIFEPVEEKIQLEEETKESILGKLEDYFEEENLWEKITPNMIYLTATYSNGKFPGGPRFMIKPEEDTEEEAWWLRISSGPINYMAFDLDKENKKIEITDLTFTEEAYSSVIVEGWVDNVLTGLRVAKEPKGYLKWDTKYNTK